MLDYWCRGDCPRTTPHAPGMFCTCGSGWRACVLIVGPGRTGACPHCAMPFSNDPERLAAAAALARITWVESSVFPNPGEGAVLEEVVKVLCPGLPCRDKHEAKADRQVDRR